MNFPSVTGIISPYCDFSTIPAGVLQHAGERGTEVDRLCGCVVNGEFIVPNEECRPYVESFQKWYQFMVVETILNHVRLAHPSWGYHGELDLLCRLKDGRSALIDIKTPIALKKAWQVQLAGYRELCIVNGHAVDCVASLRLSPKGSMAKVNWYENSAIDFNIFIQALNCKRFFES